MNLLFPTKNIELELGETITFNQVTGKLDASRIEGDLPAEQSSYDNTESGLEATNVQDAIDEVNTKIDNIPAVDAYTKEESDDKFATKTALQTVANAVSGKADATAVNEALGQLTEAVNGKASASEVTALSGSVEGLEDEVEAINDGIDEYVYTLIPYDRQLFNWKTMTPATPIKKMFNSSNLIVENTSCRLYFIEVEGKADEYYSFNIINPDNFHANALYMFASNSLDVGASVKSGSTNIDNKCGYVKLDGAYRYICFAISSTLSNQEAITTECNDIVKKLVIRRSIGSVGYDTTYYPYEVYPVYKVDVPNDFEYRHSKTLLCGDNLLLNDASTVGTGWSGSLASGYTHSSGSNELVFSGLPLTNGKKYVVIFDATGDLGSWLFVKLGASVFVDVYNGITSFAIGFVSDGTGTLTFKPTNQFAGTVSNIEVREVDAGSNEIVLPKYENIDRGLAENVTGFWNTSISPDGLQKNINGSRNVAIGYESLHDFKSGTRNLALGTFAMNRLESGDRNIAVGTDSMWYAKKATDCIALGHNSMSGVGTALEHNIAIGQDSLAGVTTGTNNIAIGFSSVAYPQSSSLTNTTCIGVQSGNYANTNCTYIGNRSGYQLKGINNTCLGTQSGAQQYTTGQSNCFIGVQCGIDNTGATSSNPKTVDNSIAIGFQARATKSNQAMIGSANVTEVVFCGNKKINFNLDGTVTWETLT